MQNWRSRRSRGFGREVSVLLDGCRAPSERGGRSRLGGVSVVDRGGSMRLGGPKHVLGAGNATGFWVDMSGTCVTLLRATTGNLRRQWTAGCVTSPTHPSRSPRRLCYEAFPCLLRSQPLGPSCRRDSLSSLACPGSAPLATLWSISRRRLDRR